MHVEATHFSDELKNGDLRKRLNVPNLHAVHNLDERSKKASKRST